MYFVGVSNNYFIVDWGYRGSVKKLKIFVMNRTRTDIPGKNNVKTIRKWQEITRGPENKLCLDTLLEFVLQKTTIRQRKLEDKYRKPQK